MFLRTSLINDCITSTAETIFEYFDDSNYAFKIFFKLGVINRMTAKVYLALPIVTSSFNFWISIISLENIIKDYCGRTVILSETLSSL